jgi:hypothetical protein
LTRACTHQIAIGDSDLIIVVSRAANRAVEFCYIFGSSTRKSCHQTADFIALLGGGGRKKHLLQHSARLKLDRPGSSPSSTCPGQDRG